MLESQSRKVPIARFGAFELHLRTGELRKSGLRVSLPDQPLQVLTLLLERCGELVSREELRQRLWPADTFVDFEQGLNAAVKRLRAVLGDSADVPRFIETLPRRGYRWIYPLEAVVELEKPRLSTRWLAIGAVALALGGVTLKTRKVPPPAPEPPSRLRVAPLTMLRGAESGPALSPDGKHVAYCWEADGARGLYVKGLGDGRQVRIADGLAGLFSPTWSPDGREIAFLRRPKRGERRDEIVVVPVAGGPERRLGTAHSSNPGLDWAPDGSLLAFVDKVVATGPDAIYLLTLATGERRRLTTPMETSAPDGGDYGPSFSRDGHSVAFIRRSGAAPTTTGVYVHEIGSSDSRAVTTGYGVRRLAWTPDGGSLVFVGGRPNHGALWVVDAAGGKPRRLYDDDNVASVSLARASGTLTIEQRAVDINVWRGSGPASAHPEPPRAYFASPRMDVYPGYSADGRRIAFASHRKGGLGVRLCDEDGTRCVEFKSDEYLSRPQWSPDGKSLVATGWQGDQPLDVFRLEVEGGFVRRLTNDNAVDTMPSWSRDGRWLYFASDRSGAYQVWKMPSSGGEARQLTRRGGLLAKETADGRWIYFTNAAPFGTLWRMAADGGDETLVLDAPIHHSKWTLWRDRVVYVDEQTAGSHHVVMFDPSSRRSVRLASLGRASGEGLAVSPDGVWILYTQQDQVTSDIMVLEGFK